MSRIKKRKIIGWEIQVFTQVPGIGRVPDYRIEYGNSPVRDRRSRLEKVSELMLEGKDFTTKPIYNRGLTEEEIAKAVKANCVYGKDRA